MFSKISYFSFLSNVVDSCDGILISFEVAIFIVSKNLYGCAVLRIKFSESSFIFFAAPTAVAVCGSNIKLYLSEKFLIISKVSWSLVFSAQKSFFIIFTSYELSLNEPLDKRFDIKFDTVLSQKDPRLGASVSKSEIKKNGIKVY